jgi:hypothetical protein
LLRAAFGSWFAGITSAPYWNIIQIVIGGVIAILILIFIWRLAECAGIVRMGEINRGIIELASSRL